MASIERNELNYICNSSMTTQQNDIFKTLHPNEPKYFNMTSYTRHASTNIYLSHKIDAILLHSYQMVKDWNQAK